MATAKRRRISKRAIQQWTAGIQVTWTPAKVRSALYNHQAGDFANSARLATSMLNDDEYAGSLERAIEQIVGAPFTVAPADDNGEPNAASQALADQIEPVWFEMVPEAQLVQALQWYLQLKVMVGTLDWSFKDGLLVPTLRVLNPEFLEFEPDQKNHMGLYGKWTYDTREGREEVIPGDGKWVLWEDGRDGWHNCGVRALGNTWLGKQYTWRDWLRYNERHGLPIVKLMVPSAAEPDEKDQIASDVSSLGSDTTVALPHWIDEGQDAGYDLELLEATDKSWESFQATIERADRKFQVYFLGSNTASELVGSQGSRAAAEASQDTTAGLAHARARRVSTFIRDQIVAPFARFNMATPPVLPWPQWDVDPKGVEHVAQGLKELGDGLSALKNAGYTVPNIASLMSDTGIELEEVEVEEPEPVPASNQNDREELSSVELAANDTQDSMLAAQEYADGLAEHYADVADRLENISAKQVEAMLDAATDEDDLKARLSAYVDDADPTKLARAFESVMILASYAGTFAAQED